MNDLDIWPWQDPKRPNEGGLWIPVPGAAILKGITRCESLCNPAVIEKRLFSIHVRQLPAGQGKGWVVRIIYKELIGANDEPLRRPKGGARKLSLNPVCNGMRNPSGETKSRYVLRRSQSFEPNL